MKQRIENQVVITCDDVDLTTLANLEVYIKQGHLFFQYVPEVKSSSEMLVTIPYEDAMQLKSHVIELQFAFTYPNGASDASNVVIVPVDKLLKEAGYDPN